MQFDFGKELFSGSSTTHDIPAGTKVVVVSDMFVSDYVGGAELTTQALIDSSPFPIHKMHSRDVTLETLEKGKDLFWVFGNFTAMNLELIPTVIGNQFKYAICEYDYKYCKYRSPQKHAEIEKTPCNCHNDNHGKLISAFFYAAKSIWWMSEKQRDRYFQMFPFLEERDNTVLSSVFDDKFFVRVKLLVDRYAGTERKKWIVLGSKSWIKGLDAAIQWCEHTGKEYDVVWDVSYEKMLEKLAQAEGFVYLPLGGDTCPRMTIEAKLLGCKLHMNDNVQHKDEEWFATDDLLDTESYLFLSRSRFWAGIRKSMEYVPTLSGYTTTYNCISQEYPFEQCIESMRKFCDEIVIIDGGSDDGTWEKLQSIAEEFRSDAICKIRPVQIKRDWTHPRSAVFDGLQKAEARKLCTSDFCWQQDSDEVVDTTDVEKIKDLLERFPQSMKILALPIIEYWGGHDKVRIDVNPWKWRLSKNDPSITHGIPTNLRKVDANGDTYAIPGTDGCDLIDATTGDVLPHGTFYTHDVDQVRRAAWTDDNARKSYQSWLESVTSQLPTVLHFSWWHLARKIATYKNFWGRHWKSLYDIEIADTAENNTMFDKPWSEVSDAEIEKRASLMKDRLGGWIFHKKWDGKSETPYVSLNRPIPQSMVTWCVPKEQVNDQTNK